MDLCGRLDIGIAMAEISSFNHLMYTYHWFNINKDYLPFILSNKFFSITLLSLNIIHMNNNNIYLNSTLSMSLDKYVSGHESFQHQLWQDFPCNIDCRTVAVSGLHKYTEKLFHRLSGIRLLLLPRKIFWATRHLFESALILVPSILFSRMTVIPSRESLTCSRKFVLSWSPGENKDTSMGLSPEFY